MRSTAHAAQRSGIPLNAKKEIKHCKVKLNILLLSHRIFSRGLRTSSEDTDEYQNLTLKSPYRKEPVDTLSPINKFTATSVNAKVYRKAPAGCF